MFLLMLLCMYRLSLPPLPPLPPLSRSIPSLPRLRFVYIESPTTSPRGLNPGHVMRSAVALRADPAQ